MVGLFVDVKLKVLVTVGVSVGVEEGVEVKLKVLVIVGVSVGVDVGVEVKLKVLVTVGENVSVGVLVGDRVGVARAGRPGHANTWTRLLLNSVTNKVL